MDPYTLHRSLLDTTTTTAIAYDVHNHTLTSLPPKVDPKPIPNVPNIILRVMILSVVATVAIWANHEGSKGFSIVTINEAGKYSSPGKRFSIFYESNDKATRIVLNTSSFVEHLLYPNQDLQHTKKQINSVTLRLAPTSFPEIVSVYSRKPYEYVIKLSPSLMERSSSHDEFVLAVLQGMARVWLWDGKGATPSMLLHGMVEYISTLAGFSNTKVLNSGTGVSIMTLTPPPYEICWKDEDPRKVAGFLRYHDQRQQAGGGEVIRRLNKRMIEGWNDQMMDDALGMAGQHACATYNILTRHHHPSSSI
ncbi:uncharacterized protein LOC143545964 [Bidens hawaiensis]|uniref:uncharacterized protein LOC143545964 n=1 Tax=Bidens hawaiensis TaxID=980011 RepID=UPI004048F2D0